MRVPQMNYVSILLPCSHSFGLFLGLYPEPALQLLLMTFSLQSTIIDTYFGCEQQAPKNEHNRASLPQLPQKEPMQTPTL